MTRSLEFTLFSSCFPVGRYLYFYEYFTSKFIHLSIIFFQAQPSSLAEAMILDTEAAVIANFDFLAHDAVDIEDDDDMSDDMEPPDDDDQDDVKTAKRKGKVRKQ